MIFIKKKNGLNNTNAPNLMIIEFNVKDKTIRKVVHKLTYLKSIVSTNGKCPLTLINISHKCLQLMVENLKSPLPIININNELLKTDYMNVIKNKNLIYLI
jgi:hypothetical protein